MGSVQHLLVRQEIGKINLAWQKNVMHLILISENCNMLETAEVILVTVSAIVISFSFCYCFTVNNHTGQMDIINNNQEVETTNRRKKKKSDNRRGSVNQTRQSSVSSSRRSSMSITGQVGSTGVQQEQLAAMQARMTATERELVEIKMRNLKLLKLTENLEEKNENQGIQIEKFKVRYKAVFTFFLSSKREIIKAFQFLQQIPEQTN